MSLNSYDAFISQAVGSVVMRTQPLWGNLPSATLKGFSTQIAGGIIQGLCQSQLMPGSLPSGVTAFVPTHVNFMMTTAGVLLLAKAVSLGSFDIGANSFTDGSAMPSQTLWGTASTQLASPIIAEVTTALSFTSTCTLTCTYKNQGGTGGQTTSAVSLTTASTVGTAGYMQLANGDTGCADITAVTRGGSPGTPSGVVQFWGLIPICMTAQNQAPNGSAENLLNGGMNFVKLGINDRIRGFSLGATTARGISGSIVLVGDN